MKRVILILMALALLVTSLPAMASEEFPMIGSPLPDFTLTDTDGNTLTLSEILKEKQLVVISIFASFCTYCDKEFPAMQQICDKYSDQMELMALSAYAKDTMDIMAQYKADRDLTFHFGLTEGTGITDIVPIPGYPTNVFIDRFGNMGFIESGMFPSAGAFERTVLTFLGDDYTETVTLDSIPVAPMNVPYPDEAELSAALTGENIELSCEVDKTEGVYPFVPETRGDHTALFASNMGIETSKAHMVANFTSKEGDALYFEVGTDMPALVRPLIFTLDGVDVKYFTQNRDWTPWAVALEPGEHKAEFTYDIYIPDGVTTYVGIDNMSLVSGDEAAELLDALNVYPVSEETYLAPANEDARQATILIEGEATDGYFYVSNEDQVKVAIYVAESVDPDAAMIVNSVTRDGVLLAELPVVDDAFIYEYPNTDNSYAQLEINVFTEDLAVGDIFFCKGEESADDMIKAYEASGSYSGLSWSYVDELPDNASTTVESNETQPAEAAAVETEATYTVTVVDQNGDPVPEVSLTFCEDTACHLAEGDENGVVTFTGKPAKYHVQVVDAPEEYDFPEDSDFYTEDYTSELTIAITKE